MVEWWAYLADILTFYNERIANDAPRRRSPCREREPPGPAPGLPPAASARRKVTLAGLLAASARVPVALPEGMQAQSKPGPGETPQVFELDAASQLQSPDIIPANVVPTNQSCSPTPPRRPRPTHCGSPGLKVADRLLLINAQALAAAPSIGDYAWIAVTAVQPTASPLGNPVTAVSFTPIASTLTANAQAANYVLLRGGQSSPLWGFPTTTPS